MMRRLLFTLGVLAAFTGVVEAQQEVLRSDGRRTQVDTYLRALKTLHLPYGPTPTFDGGLQKEGSIFYNTTDNSLYVWDGSVWVQVAPDTDLSNYYTKSQTDSLLTYYATVQELNDGLALKVDKTTTINGHALSGNITLTAADVGALTKALADTYYKDINWVPAWEDITNKPSTFTPSPHTHPISQVTGLQDALDAKQATITGAASTITSADLTADRALVSSGAGKVAVSTVTSTELGYISGVTSGIQGQIDNKVDKSTTITNTGGINIGGSLASGNVSLGLNETYLNNRYLRKDRNDDNDDYTLSVGKLVGDTVNASRLELGSLATTSENEYLVVDALGVVSKRTIDQMTFDVSNSGGTTQFSVGDQDQIRFQGTGDTQVSFNAATKTIVINSVPGQGGGGVVTSVFGRDGGVVAEAGDYNTDLVTEGSNLYFTDGRVRSTELTGLTLSTSPITATDNVLQALGKAQGQINNRALASRELEVSGTAGRIIVSGGAQNLTQDREWIVDLVASGVSAGTYPKVTVDAYGRVTAGASLVAADIPNLPAGRITSGTFDLARLATGTAAAGYYIDGGTGAWTPLPSTDLTNYYTKTETDDLLDDKYDIPTGTTGQYVRGDGSLAAFPTIPQGTVTSVGISVPSDLLSVTGSPVTSSGTFNVTLPNRAANLVFAGPATGSAASPTFRSLVQNDIPALAISKVTGLQDALDGKEGAFSKGSLVAGDGVTLSGTLANRLVGAGNVTISADIEEANLIAGAGISITGAYPDKTITNTAPNATHTGDVTGSGELTIANGVVTNTKLANVPTGTIKGRVTAGSGSPEDLTPAQVRALINVANGATANQTDAYLLNRANHTGTQAISTIVGLADELGGKESLSNKATNFNTINNILYPSTQAVANYVTAQIANIPPTDLSDYYTSNQTDSAITSELLGYVPITRTINGKALSSDITITQSDVGLGNVDNTSDLDKPISTAAQNALDGKEDVANKATNLVGANNTTYPTTQAVVDAIAAIPPTDLSNYYDKQETDDLLDTKIDTALLDKPNGIPLMDANGKIKMVNIPDQLIGAVNYQGTWSPATNTPTLPAVPGPETKGHYYVASDSASFQGVVYRPNDWIISSGSEWQIIEATNYVRRVNGKTGDVVLTAADVGGAVQTLSQPSIGQLAISGGNTVNLNTVNMSGNQTGIAGSKEWTGAQTFSGPNINFNSSGTTTQTLFFRSDDNNDWGIQKAGSSKHLSFNRYIGGAFQGPALTMSNSTGSVTVHNLSGTGNGIVGVNASGTLTRRPESDVIQTLSLGAGSGSIAISGGNSVDLNDLLLWSVTSPVDFSDFLGGLPSTSFTPFRTAMPSLQPGWLGNQMSGLVISPSPLGEDARGVIVIGKTRNTGSSKLSYNLGLDGAGGMTGWQTFASEEWANATLPGISTASGGTTPTESIDANNILRTGFVRAASSSTNIPLSSGNSQIMTMTNGSQKFQILGHATNLDDFYYRSGNNTWNQVASREWANSQGWLKSADVAGYVPYTGATQGVDLNTQSLTIGGEFKKNPETLERMDLIGTSAATQLNLLTNVAVLSRPVDISTPGDIVIKLPELGSGSSSKWHIEVAILERNDPGSSVRLNITAASTSNIFRRVSAEGDVGRIGEVKFGRIGSNPVIIIKLAGLPNHFSYGKVIIEKLYTTVTYPGPAWFEKANYEITYENEEDLVDFTLSGVIPNSEFIRDPYYLDYNNLANKPTIGDGTLTLATGTGLTGSASFTANQSGNATFTVEAASGYTIPTTAQATNWTTAYDYSQIGHLELTGGTVTGQIKRDADAVAGDDLPRLSQVQSLITGATISLGSGLRYDSDGAVAIGYDVSSEEGGLTEDLILLRGDISGDYSSVLVGSAGVGMSYKSDGIDRSIFIDNNSMRISGAPIRYSGVDSEDFEFWSLVHKGYVDGLLGNYLQTGDNISELVNDLNYTAAGSNITLFNNNAGYIVGGIGADEVRTNTQLDERYIQTELDPSVPQHVKDISSSDLSNWNSKISSVTGGTGITVDATDPYNPIISASAQSLIFTGDVTGVGEGTIELTLADDSVKTQHLADTAVTTAKLGNLSVTTDKIAQGAVTTSKIDTLAVTEGKLADTAVTTAKLRDKAVTLDKVQQILQGHVIGAPGAASNPWYLIEGTSWGFSEWADYFSYSPVGRHCHYEGRVYRSRIDNNLNNRPDISPSAWEDVGAWKGFWPSPNATFLEQEFEPGDVAYLVNNPGYTDFTGLLKTDVEVTGLVPGAPLTPEYVDAEMLKFGEGFLIEDNEIKIAGANSITGLILPGSNITITGTGTPGSPYYISSTAGGAGSSTLAGLTDVSVNAATNGDVLGYVDGLWVATPQTSYTLPTATTSLLGGIKLGSNTVQSVAANSPSSEAGKTYPVQLNSSGQAVVNVPWESGGYTLPIASPSVLGGIRIGSGLSIDGAGVVSVTGGGGSDFRLRSGTNAYLSNDVTLLAGTNVSLSQSGQNITINATGGGISALTGDVLASGSGSVAATIANGAVTNAKMANMAANTLKGRTGTSGTPTDLDRYQINSLLNTSRQITGPAIIIDTNKGYYDVTSSTTMSLQGTYVGFEYQLEVTNSTGSDHTLSFVTDLTGGSTVYVPEGVDTVVPAGKTVVFSFASFRSGSTRLTKVVY